MHRLERKLLRVLDALRELEAAERLVSDELGFHRHLHEDAQRDAVVSEAPLDRADARETEADVARFERNLAALQRRRRRLEAARTRLQARLGS